MTDEELLAKFNSSNKKISDLSKVEVRSPKVADPALIREKNLYLRKDSGPETYKGFMLTPEDGNQLKRLNSVHVVSIKLSSEDDPIYYRGVPANYYSVSPEVKEKLKLFNALFAELRAIDESGPDPKASRIGAEFRGSYLTDLASIDICYMYLTDGPSYVTDDGRTIKFSPGVYQVRSKSKKFGNSYADMCNATQKILSSNGIPLTGFLNNLYVNKAAKTQEINFVMSLPKSGGGYSFEYELSNLDKPFTIPEESLKNLKSTLDEEWISMSDANVEALDKVIVAMTAVKNHFAKLNAARVVADLADPYKD